ncbi:hypothetical protein FEM48_Zijuj10G0000300 [Ziziphus jujuba var. spinosa]|uniref:Uncharacterized protein n=1 Tax=Ziziphus jujuba var. spinosa TaxID=714518 RepID=A0A978UK33_ZIZJJ|nr:hypothetical protein FEM48_Zijuj10G0000300 [Ziziphus jujuba var. spinosa]
MSRAKFYSYSFAMKDNIEIGASGVPELQLDADESSAKQLSKCFLAGKILLDNSIRKNKVQIHNLLLQYVTRGNALKIGSLFKEVLRCENSSCTNIIISEDLYGPWLSAEADAFTMVAECSYLRRIKIPRGDYFNTFSNDTNTDNRNEDRAAETRASIINEQEALPKVEDKMTQN